MRKNLRKFDQEVHAMIAYMNNQKIFKKICFFYFQNCLLNGLPFPFHQSDLHKIMLKARQQYNKVYKYENIGKQNIFYRKNRIWVLKIPCDLTKNILIIHLCRFYPNKIA